MPEAMVYELRDRCGRVCYVSGCLLRTLSHSKGLEDIGIETTMYIEPLRTRMEAINGRN